MSKRYKRYYTTGVCAQIMDVKTDGETVQDVKIYGGCRGQANAIPRLVNGMTLDEAIGRLRGVECRNGTSCADQLGRILEQEKKRLKRTNETIIGTNDGKEN